MIVYLDSKASHTSGYIKFEGSDSKSGGDIYATTITEFEVRALRLQNVISSCSLIDVS